MALRLLVSFIRAAKYAAGASVRLLYLLSLALIALLYCVLGFRGILGDGKTNTIGGKPNLLPRDQPVRYFHAIVATFL